MAAGSNVCVCVLLAAGKFWDGPKGSFSGAAELRLTDRLMRAPSHVTRWPFIHVASPGSASPVLLMDGAAGRLNDY